MAIGNRGNQRGAQTGTTRSNVNDDSNLRRDDLGSQDEQQEEEEQEEGQDDGLHDGEEDSPVQRAENSSQDSREAGIKAAVDANGGDSGVGARETNSSVAQRRRAGNTDTRRTAEGATVEPPKPRAKQRLMSKTDYNFVDPTNGVRVPMGEPTARKVEVSNWMQAQIDAGLVAIYTED